MADNLPINFQLLPENTVASYSYDDIAEGTSYVTYYATGFSGVGNTTALLRKEIMPIGSGGGTTLTLQGADTKVIDDDKDLIFNTTRNIKGKLLVNLSWTVGDGTCASNYSYFVVKARKVSGGVESEIASVTTNAISGSANNTYYQSEQMYIEIPQTHFSVGDIFRITIEGWGHLISSTVPANFAYNGDPQNTPDGAYSFTYLKFAVPYLNE